MSEKRVARRSLSFKVAIICIIVAVGVIGAFAYYRIILNGKNTTDDSNVSIHTFRSGSQYDAYAGSSEYVHTDMPHCDYKEP